MLWDKALPKLHMPQGMRASSSQPHMEEVLCYAKPDPVVHGSNASHRQTRMRTHTCTHCMPVQGVLGTCTHGHDFNTVPCTTAPVHAPFYRFGYERDLLRYTEQLIRDMDRKIEKNKERAAAESRPKPIRPEDQLRLDEIKARMDGGCGWGSDRWGWRLIEALGVGAWTGCCVVGVAVSQPRGLPASVWLSGLCSGATPFEISHATRTVLHCATPLLRRHSVNNAVWCLLPI